jgi:transcriptional regulator with PAS, ATPase and Fis domain
VTILLTGETGTGKDILARLIHEYSPRANKMFVPFNCTAVPREMLDSQLFGHRRGAFTGAQEQSPGVIRGAVGGTLFLDEIGEIGVEAQVKLLRFLESTEVHPIGESYPSRSTCASSPRRTVTSMPWSETVCFARTCSIA